MTDRKVQPTIYLHPRRIHPDGRQERSLCGPRFVRIFLRVEIERRLNLAVTQDALAQVGKGRGARYTIK